MKEGEEIFSSVMELVSEKSVQQLKCQPRNVQLGSRSRIHMRTGSPPDKTLRQNSVAHQDHNASRNIPHQDRFPEVERTTIVKEGENHSFSSDHGVCTVEKSVQQLGSCQQR